MADDTVIEIAAPPASVVIELIPGTTPQVVEVTTVPAPPGGGSGEVHTQSIASSQWHFTHSLGRMPTVGLYDLNNQVIMADISATVSDITITFANQQTGRVVLT